jgi:spermidine/putrescine-binding protein
MNKVGYHLPEDHPAAFAATHEGYEALRWRVPADDTTTMHFTLYFAPRVAHTFGGRKGLAEIEATFNKKFDPKARINFAAGPDMNARAARHITEIKSGGKVSSDIFFGSQSHLALLHEENALEKVNYSKFFPWVTKAMEIFPNEGVLVYTSPNGIIYNSSLIAKDKAPKSYTDLIDPRLSPGPGWAK